MPQPATATSAPPATGAPENAAASPDLRERPLHEDIAAAARELWIRYGRPSGRDEQIWLEAERQVMGLDPVVSRIGAGVVAADALNQSSPAPSTASPGGAPAPPGSSVSPDPASS